MDSWPHLNGLSDILAYDADDRGNMAAGWRRNVIEKRKDMLRLSVRTDDMEYSECDLAGIDADLLYSATIRSFAFDAVALFISVLDNWCTRVLQSRSVPDGLLEFRPSKQISQTRLEIIRLSLICCGNSLAPFGHQYHVLGQLVLC